VCFQIVRVLARMDVYRRLTWVSNQDPEALPADVPPDLLERTISSSTAPRPPLDALRRLRAALRALPLGRLWAWPLLLPGRAPARGRRL